MFYCETNIFMKHFRFIDGYDLILYKEIVFMGAKM
jgi:hypothetical protein